MPENLLSSFNSKIKREWKIAFISAVIIGFLTHLYVMTNMLPNHDGLINIYNTQLKFKSGRFFLGPFSGISSYFDLPWINGSLAILYLSLMSVLIVILFDLKKTLSIVLTSGLIVAFPTVAATFSYMFTADGYMAGFLLAVLSILVTKKWKYGFIPGAIIFYISVGIYQANLNIFLMIVAVWLIRELLFGESSLSTNVYHLIKQIAAVSIGMALYTITFNVYQKAFGGEIVDYQGLTEIGQRSGRFLEPFIKIKNAFIDFFFRGFTSTASVNLLEILNVLIVIIVMVGVFIAIRQSKVYRKPVELILALVGIVALPFLAFILYFVSPGVSYHMLMVMSLVLFYLLPIVIYDKLEIPTPSVKWFSWATVVVTMVVIFNFAVINNIAYFNMTLKYEKSYALVNRMLDRIEQTEGYENAKQLAVIGRISMKTELVSQKVAQNIPVMTGAMGDHFLAESYHYEYMLANQFGKTLTRVTPEVQLLLQDTEEVQKMKVWPAEGSVYIMDDIVIIKLND